MCGLGGYSGITDTDARLRFAMALGLGLDSRGGHAAGYVSLSSADSGKGIGMARRAGKWSDSSWRFMKAAASGEVAIYHARYATCGEKDNPLHAHPFAIRRGDKAVLYGAHNGIVYGGRDTAKEAGREYTVDSKELFELLADGDLAAIQGLSGYGVINWVTPESGVVRMARLSLNSDFACVRLAGGGIAWASTMSILEKAVESAGLTAETTLLAPEVGVVYSLTPEGIQESGRTGIRVNAGGKKQYSSGGNYYAGSGYSNEYESWLYGVPTPLPAHRSKSEGPMFRPGDTFVGSDGIAWTYLLSGWKKDSEIAAESSKSNATSHVRVATGTSSAAWHSSALSRTARPGECIHGAKLRDHCDSCTGPLTKVAKEEPVPDTKPSARHFPAIQVVDGDIEWEPVERDNGAIVWIPTDLDAMTDSQLAELTEVQWEELMARYTPEEEEETPDSRS